MYENYQGSTSFNIQVTAMYNIGDSTDISPPPIPLPENDETENNDYTYENEDETLADNDTYKNKPDDEYFNEESDENPLNDENNFINDSYDNTSEHNSTTINPELGSETSSLLNASAFNAIISFLSFGPVRVYGQEPNLYSPSFSLPTYTTLSLYWYQDGKRRQDKGVTHLNLANSAGSSATTNVSLYFNKPSYTDAGLWFLRADNGADFFQSEYTLNLTVGIAIQAFNIKNVANQEQLTAAINSSYIDTINITESFYANANDNRITTSNRQLTINGNGNTLTLLPTVNPLYNKTQI